MRAPGEDLKGLTGQVKDLSELGPPNLRGKFFELSGKAFSSKDISEPRPGLRWAGTGVHQSTAAHGSVEL